MNPLAPCGSLVLWLSWLLTRQPHGCHAGKGQEQNSGKQKGSRINCAETGSPQSKVRRVEEQRTHSELSCSCPAKHLAVLCLCTLPGAVSLPGDFPSVILWDQQAQSRLENSGQHCDCEWAFRTVSYGYNIYESKLPGHVGTVVYFQGSAVPAWRQHATPERSEVYQIQSSLHWSSCVLVCKDFCSAKTQFSAPPSSCSSGAAREKLHSLFRGYKQVNASSGADLNSEFWLLQ